MAFIDYPLKKKKRKKKEDKRKHLCCSWISQNLLKIEGENTSTLENET